jgi:long-chain acyl-CoA synthetase
MADETLEVAQSVSAALKLGLAERGDADAIAFNGSWRSWRWLEQSAHTLEDVVRDARIAHDSFAVLVARNRPQHVAAMAAQIAARRTTIMVHSMQSASGIAADIAKLQPVLVMADEDDWSEELRDIVASLGGVGIVLRDGDDQAMYRHPDLPGGGARSLSRSRLGTAFELLSSGTTGPPKRIPLSWEAVDIIVSDAQLAYAGTEQRGAPLLMLHPLGNIAGLAYLVPALVYGQRTVLLEKFEVYKWADAVRTYRPARSSLPPAGMRMVLEAHIPRISLESLKVIAVGGAKLDPDLHTRFEDAYGIPVLTAYGATEFGGVIANWTLPLYQRYGKTKLGSVGRASANISLRIVDRETSAELPVGSVGLLEAHIPRIGAGWTRTTDLGSLDEEGFLFLHGRADAAINRGGFKILPDEVVHALKMHPDVLDAAVVGLPDSRLGEVPVAAVELRRDATLKTEEALKAFARSKLLAYQVPAIIRIVPALPRNSSMKVSLAEVRELFAWGDSSNGSEPIKP